MFLQIITEIIIEFEKITTYCWWYNYNYHCLSFAPGILLGLTIFLIHTFFIYFETHLFIFFLSYCQKRHEKKKI